MILLDSLCGLGTVRHGFFTRIGGVSEGLYAAKNCGFGSGDNPDNVARNRARCVAEMADGVAALVTAYQVHSSAAAVVEAPWQPKDAPQVDGLVTDRPNLALGILTAEWDDDGRLSVGGGQGAAVVEQQAGVGLVRVQLV